MGSNEHSENVTPCLAYKSRARARKRKRKRKRERTRAPLFARSPKRMRRLASQAL